MRLNNHFLNQKARVELLPLIDVVFLLLVFFIYMMLSMVVQRGMDVELPQVSDSQSVSEEFLQITVTKKNNILVEGLPSSLESLSLTVNKLLVEKQKPILIRGDRQTDLGIALQVLNNLQAAGYQKVSFSVDKPADTMLIEATTQ